MNRIRILVIVLLLSSVAACAPNKPAAGTDESSTQTASDATTPHNPVATEPTAGWVPPPDIPRLESVRNRAPYDWAATDVKLLDPWGDAPDSASDLVAIYERRTEDDIEIRADILDMAVPSPPTLSIAIDFTDGGTTAAQIEGEAVDFDISWDLLVGTVAGEPFLIDSSLTDLTDELLGYEMSNQLDFVSFHLPRTLFRGADESFMVQAVALDSMGSVSDRTAAAATSDSTGRAKLVLVFGNGMLPGTSGIDWYDGYAQLADRRPGEPRGMRNLLDGIEMFQLPLTWLDLRVDLFPTNEFLGINRRLAALADAGLFVPLMAPGYGHDMAWQSADVDTKAFDLATEMWNRFGFSPSPIAAPYEATITVGDINVLRDSGFSAIYGNDQYHYWFGGWIDDWSDDAGNTASVAAVRKIHLINGMPFLFDTSVNNYGGYLTDDRWGQADPKTEYDEYLGTDGGLDIGWRRVLHDLAISTDQEQYFEIGTDLGLTPWVFADVVEQNLGWLAAHPWIEVTTHASILDRGWQPIDHGTLPLGRDDLLLQYPLAGDDHYNAYLPLHYMGGVADGHSPLVPAGTKIESYYDYAPFLDSGVAIPSGRVMGDESTAGSIIGETVANLRAAPDNPLTMMAWLAYLNDIGEQTFHGEYDGATGDLIGAETLGTAAKTAANFVGQVNKLVAAAAWADQARRGEMAATTAAIAADLDLDGEDEYVLSNDRTYAIFENDGGRLEYAFAFDPEYGPVQIVAPQNEYTFLPGPPVDPSDGEAALPMAWPTSIDGAFVDSTTGDGVFDYSIFSAAIGTDSVTFTSSGGYQKTFSLSGDTIEAEYAGTPATGFDLGVSMVTDMVAMFEPGWPTGYVRLERDNGVGWQLPGGGSGLFSTDEDVGWSASSFIDSPAPFEQYGRADTSGYPPGHWLPLPQAWINVSGATDGAYFLTVQSGRTEN